MVAKKKEPNDEKRKCGLVMPISLIDGCDEKHWQDVKDIVSDAVESVGFEPNLVSYADDVGIIQKRIIQNLYENPVVVCDVSGKNPNVMFELGLRLAFDKPTIIIKDDKTSYSFDTSPIEHLEYPRDLRFTNIIEFKENLSEKVKATYDRAKTDPNYTTFLKHFGTFTAARIDTQEVSKEDYIIEEIKDLKEFVFREARRQQMVNPPIRQMVKTLKILGKDSNKSIKSDVSKNDFVQYISDFSEERLANSEIGKVVLEYSKKCDSDDELLSILLKHKYTKILDLNEDDWRYIIGELERYRKWF